jgi:hypothetical protein
MARVVAYRFATEELPAGPVPMSSPRQTADAKLRVIYGTIEIPSGATLGIDDEPEWRAPTLLRELWRASAPGDPAEVVPGPVILDEDAPSIATALLAERPSNVVPRHWSTDPGEMAIFGLNDDGDKEYIDPDPGSMAVQAASDWEGQELPNTTPAISEPDHVVLQQTPMPPNAVRLIGGDDELAAATIGIDDEPPVIPRMGELPQNRPPIPPDDAEAFPITGALDDDTPPTWGLQRPGEVPRIQQFADDAVVAPTPIVDDESAAPAIPPHRSLWARVLAFFLDPFELPGSVPTYPAIPYRALLLDTTPRVLLIDAVGIPIMTKYCLSSADLPAKCARSSRPERVSRSRRLRGALPSATQGPLGDAPRRERYGRIADDRSHRARGSLERQHQSAAGRLCRRILAAARRL